MNHFGDKTFQDQTEEVLVVLDAGDKNQGFRQKAVTVVVTTQRIIIANKETNLVKQFQKDYLQGLEAEGQKGFGKFLAIAASDKAFTERYLNMPPDSILAESRDNYDFPADDIQEMKISGHNDMSFSEDEEYKQKQYVKMLIRSGNKKYKYDTKANVLNKEIFTALEDLLGSRFNAGKVKFY